MVKNKTYLLLFFVIALAFFLRIYKIDTIPPGIFADEAENGIDALVANETGQYQWFYPGNQGREGLFMNLVALSFMLFGVSALTLKLPAIIFGTLTVWGVYLLAKELFDSRRAGLLSSFLVAVSYWAINFSRISFRANMVPAILAFSFYFLFRAVRTKKWQDFAVGGLIFGLGLHSYISFRVAPLILVVMLFVLILTRESFLKHYWKLILVFVFSAFITAAPMLYTFFIAHPEYWVSRSASISILNPQVNQGDLAGTFLKTLGLSLAKYNFWGDQNWRHNYPPYAILDPLTGIMFLFGFIYSIIKTFRLLYLRFAKKIRDTKLETHVFLLTAFFTMLIPEIMGYEGNPHALRAIGTIPAVFIFAGLGFGYFLGQAENYSHTHRKITAALTILMLLSIGLFNPIKYFIFWANKPETAKAFDYHLREITYSLKDLPESTEKFLIADEYPSRPIKVMTQKVKNLTFVWPGHIQYISLKTINPVIILVDPTEATVAEINKMFPDLNTYPYDKPGGGHYLVFKNN